MNTIILYPSDYFHTNQVDSDFELELLEARKCTSFQIVIYNHDEFIEGKPLKLYPSNIEGLCIARTWMFSPQKYEEFYQVLAQRNINLINTPQEYANLHLFPNVYPFISAHTPNTIYFEDLDCLDIPLINKEFRKFLVKDYVKSLKGTSFPSFVETPVASDYFADVLNEFIRLRGNLYTGGIVLKEFVALKKYGNVTNEYRAFFLNNHLLTLSKNSNQTKDYNAPSLNFVNQFRFLNSNYYTVDFAELETGAFIVLETGDGQVSGLSPGQFIMPYYEKMENILNN